MNTTTNESQQPKVIFVIEDNSEGLHPCECSCLSAALVETTVLESEEHLYDRYRLNQYRRASLLPRGCEVNLDNAKLGITAAAETVVGVWKNGEHIGQRPLGEVEIDGEDHPEEYKDTFVLPNEMTSFDPQYAIPVLS